jgi:16S rRNA (guanine(527)-N(7))-methyltransferase RsmG
VTAFGEREAAVYADQFEIYHGNANPELARKIAHWLGGEPGQAEVFQFANENIFVRILDNVREKDVFVVQPTCRPVNQSIMELLIMIDAFKRASAGRITAVVPYYAYGRSDKCPPNVRSPHAACAHRAARSARGHGETRAGTEGVAQHRVDACSGRTNDAGSGSRADLVHDQQEGALDRPRGPLPTRVSDLPPLPAAYEAVLEPGLRALDLALAPDARDAIDAHARFLLAWTQAINLTAIRDPAEVARLHVLDSLAAVPLLRALGVRALLDLGSGGGYPGLPLAVALDADRALLMDSIARRCASATVIEATGLGDRVHAETARAEALAHAPADREAWPAVTARAVGSLVELVEVGLPLVAPGGVLVAWKRAPLDAELAAAAGTLAALRAGPVAVHEVNVLGLEAHRLVVVPRGGPIDGRFPRDPAERRRRPL